MTALILPTHIERRIAADDDGCWLWTGSTSPDGYGWTSLNNRTHQAHRLVYRLLVGEPPAGLVLDHLCRVRRCVNPKHLEPVTVAENLRRGDTPAGWKCCQNCGAEYASVRNQRRCLSCLGAYESRRRERKRLAERERRARLREARRAS